MKTNQLRLLFIIIFLSITTLSWSQLRKTPKSPKVFFDAAITYSSNLSVGFMPSLHVGYRFNSLLGVGLGYEYQSGLFKENNLLWANVQGSTNAPSRKGWYYLAGLGVGQTIYNRDYAGVVESSPITALDLNLGRHLSNNLVLAIGYRLQHQMITHQNPTGTFKDRTLDNGFTISSRFVLGNEKYTRAKLEYAKPTFFDRLYTDLWISVGDGTGMLGIEFASDISLGYQLDEKNGIGISLINNFGFSNLREISLLRMSGIGLQYRKKSKKLVFAGELGRINRYKDGYGREHEYYEFKKSAGFRPYAQLMAGVKLNDLLMVGLQSTSLFPVRGTYEYRDYIDGTEQTGETSRGYRTVQVVIGISFN